MAIAEDRSRDKEEGMEVTWEKKEGEKEEMGASGTDKEHTKSDWECTDEEYNRRMGKGVFMYFTPRLGEFTDHDKELIADKIKNDYREFKTRRKANYMM